MTDYELKVDIESYASVGSGESYGAYIDDDVVYDTFGLPYLPGKRIKGLLRESALEISEMNMGSVCKIKIDDILKLFGTTTLTGKITVGNLRLEDYDNLKKWIGWAFSNDKTNTLINKNSVLSCFTEIKQHTAIDDDATAKEHSLRTVRVLKPLCFNGSLRGDFAKEEQEHMEKVLTLACINLRRLGTKRNKGYGKVKCSFSSKDNDLTGKLLVHMRKHLNGSPS